MVERLCLGRKRRVTRGKVQLFLFGIAPRANNKTDIVKMFTNLALCNESI